MGKRETRAAMNTRRSFLYTLGASLGSVAFSDLLAKETESPLAPKDPHLAPRAKACIFLVMEGGPSHIDTFDPKPKLEELHMKHFENVGEHFSPMSSGQRYYVQSPYKFRKVGQAGIDMCEHFAHLPQVADELCIYKGCQAESVDHPTALYHINAGNKFGGDPAVGSWVTYGLGSENQNLPGYIVLSEAGFPQGGAGNLDQRVSPRLLPRHAAARRRVADSRHPSARLENPRASARQSRCPGGAQSRSPGPPPRPR